MAVKSGADIGFLGGGVEAARWFSTVEAAFGGDFFDGLAGALEFEGDLGGGVDDVSRPAGPFDVGWTAQPSSSTADDGGGVGMKSLAGASPAAFGEPAFSFSGVPR